jgi:hypothetical protein
MLGCEWMTISCNPPYKDVQKLSRSACNTSACLSFPRSQAQLYKVEALLKIVGWLKVDLLQVWDEDDGYILKV